MKNRNIIYLLILACIIAVIAGFFASTHPDGLEKTAHNLGFSGKAMEQPAVFIDYILPVPIPDKVSTAIAGIIGILIIYFVFRFISNGTIHSVAKGIIDYYKKLYDRPDL